jgi:hypothetical protein
MQCSSPRGSYDTTSPLSDILRNQDATRRISKWDVELGALNIDFKPRTTIKSQALVDFMAEWRENLLPTPTERPEHWDRNKENMDAYYLEVRKLKNKFYGLEFHHIVRDSNVAADVLSKLGSTRAQVPAGVFVHELHAPSIPQPAPTTTDPAHPPAGQEVMMIDVDWRQPFIDYLREQKVPSDKNLVEQRIRRAKSYVLVGDKLYRRGASSGVLMKCVP